MIINPKWLLAPYALNILILIPICYAVVFGAGVTNVFEGVVEESPGLRLLVGSLWSAILFASIAGLIWPAFFAPVILVQIIYKSMWLALFILPLWMAGKPFPFGISATFVFIVLTYPFALWMAMRA